MDLSECELMQNREDFEREAVGAELISSKGQSHAI